MAPSDIRDAFLGYLADGWHPVPFLVVANADNTHRSKVPMLAKVAPFFDTAPTEADFDTWQTPENAQSMGLAFALPPGVVVVDIDGRDGPLTSVPSDPWLEGLMGSVTMWTKTFSGFHFFFRAPDGATLKNGADLGPSGVPFKVDIRTDRGFVVVGPTPVRKMDGTHVFAYETHNACPKENLNVLPASISDLIKNSAPAGVPAARAIDDGRVPVGRRHAVATSLALVLVNAVTYEPDVARAKEDFRKAVSELFDGDIDWEEMDRCFDSAVAKRAKEANGAWPEPPKGRVAAMRDRVRSMTASQIAADKMGMRIAKVERMEDIIKFTVDDGKSFGVPLGDMVNQAAFRKHAASGLGFFPRELSKKEYEAFLSGHTFTSVAADATAVANAIREVLASQFASVMEAEDEQTALSLAADGQWQKFGDGLYFSRIALENASRFIEKHSPSVISYTLQEMGAESRRIRGRRNETRIVWRIPM